MGKKKSKIHKIFRKIKKNIEPTKKNKPHNPHDIPVYFHTNPIVMPDGSLYFKIDDNIHPVVMRRI